MRSPYIFPARITAGALPRGLHMLNLSRNNISAIDGLRELTRLRILNLSYNRLFRIGHGIPYSGFYIFIIVPYSGFYFKRCWLLIFVYFP